MLRLAVARVTFCLLVACGSHGGQQAPAGDASTDLGSDRDTADSGTDESPGSLGDGGGLPDGATPLAAVGGACGEETPCEGESALCLGGQALPDSLGGQDLDLGFTDGYCSAVCTDSASCGTGAKCALPELLDALRPLLTLAGVSDLPNLGDVPSLCLKTCQRSNECREDYSCQGLLAGLPRGALLNMGGQSLPGADFLGRLPGLSSLGGKYCLPPPPDFDLNQSSPSVR